MSGESFLSRWSRKKIEVKTEAAPASSVQAAKDHSENPSIDAPSEAKMAGTPLPEPGLPAAPVELPPMDTLTPAADFTPFMQRNVAPALRNQAMKKLFTDPHYNVMDGLDIYIGDYTTSEPIPLAMLKSLQQSKSLFLFEEEKDTDTAPASELMSATGATEADPVPEADVQAPDVAADHDAAAEPAKDIGG